MSDQPKTCRTCQHFAEWDDGVGFCWPDGSNLDQAEVAITTDTCDIWERRIGETVNLREHSELPEVTR